MLHSRIADLFFPQCHKMSRLLDVRTIFLTQIVVIALFKKAEAQHPAVIHLSKARLPPGSGMRIITVCRMIDPDSAVPRGLCDRDVAVFVPYLSEPRHVSPCGQEHSVKNERL